MTWVSNTSSSSSSSELLRHSDDKVCWESAVPDDSLSTQLEGDGAKDDETVDHEDDPVSEAVEEPEDELDPFHFLWAFSFRSGGNSSGYSILSFLGGIWRNGTSLVFSYLLCAIHWSGNLEWHNGNGCQHHWKFYKQSAQQELTIILFSNSGSCVASNRNQSRIKYISNE